MRPALTVSKPDMIAYRDYEISYWCKPIPIRSHDWDFAHKDYDGPGDPRCGSGASVEDCKAQIDERIEEES